MLRDARLKARGLQQVSSLYEFRNLPWSPRPQTATIFLQTMCEFHHAAGSFSCCAVRRLRHRRTKTSQPPGKYPKESRPRGMGPQLITGAPCWLSFLSRAPLVLAYKLLLGVSESCLKASVPQSWFSSRASLRSVLSCWASMEKSQLWGVLKDHYRRAVYR